MYREIVRRHLPHGWKVSYSRPPRLRGDCDPDLKLIRAGALFSRNDLFVALHEIGHARLGHDGPVDQAALHVQEYEAEQYAMGVMRLEGVPVPRQEIALAKENVWDHIQRDRARGWFIDPDIERWAKPKE